MTSDASWAIVLTVSVKPNIDRRTARRQETTREIVEAAWEVVRENGLAGLSMRDLGNRVGMRAQSIYSYFASKHEIYDALFREGYEAFVEWMDVPPEQPADTVAVARHVATRFMSFCTSDPVRYQLLFQRTIPDFEPSPESWAVATNSYETGRARFAELGVHDQTTLDLWTATMTGLAGQQISNDPGGDRWERLIDRAVDMLLHDAESNDSQKGENQ